MLPILSTLLMACVPPPAPPQPTSPPSKPVEQPLWQQDWEKTLAAARIEGKVVTFTSFGSEANNAMARALKEKWGLDMEFVVGTVPQLMVKTENERRAGLFLEDMYMGGLSSVGSFKDAGYLEAVRPLLVLPEILDTKVWQGGEIFFSEKEGLMLGYQSRVVPPLVINTDLVKPDEIKSYRDLLNPKWKSQIAVFDPAKGAHGPISFMIFWVVMGTDFTRELGKQVVLVADSRQQTEWVARGKYPISGVMASDMQAEFMKAGAPLRSITPAEGTLISASKGGLGLVNKAPHPNAAKVFINWLLTKEGQSLMSQVSGDPSRRLDVSREWVADPALVAQPGIKYIDGDSEEMRQKRIESQKIYGEVWNIK